MGNLRRYRSAIPPLCKCGCGQQLLPCKDRPAFYGGEFLRGHRARGAIHSAVTREKLRQANLGKKISREAIEHMRSARHNSGLSQIEQQVVDDLISQGFTIYRDGWPDFLIEKDNVFRFIEVKRRRKHHLWKTNHGDKITPTQERMHDALRRAGIQVEIIYRER